MSVLIKAHQRGEQIKTVRLADGLFPFMEINV